MNRAEIAPTSIHIGAWSWESEKKIILLMYKAQTDTQYIKHTDSVCKIFKFPRGSGFRD